MKQRIAVFPGSFDPFTVGHADIVKRGLELFDKIIIGVGFNSEKHYFFPIDTRVGSIKTEFEGDLRVSVMPFDGLTVDFVRKNNAIAILRGVRSVTDFEYEIAIAQANRQISAVDTVFLLTAPQHTFVNSSIVRDILKHKGDASFFIPQKIYNLIKECIEK